MTYLLIMGLLAFAGSFTLCWGLWRLAHWTLTRLRPPRAKTTRKSTGKSNKKTPNPSPWRLTHGLASLRESLPLAMLTLLLHGGARLAAYGMASQAQAVPAGFSQLVSALGWLAVILLTLSVVGYWASWRCRRA